MVSKRLREGQDRGEQTEGLDSRWPVFAERTGTVRPGAPPARPPPPVHTPVHRSSIIDRSRRSAG